MYEIEKEISWYFLLSNQERVTLYVTDTLTQLNVCRETLTQHFWLNSDGQTKEPSTKGKNEYNWLPCSNKLLLILQIFFTFLQNNEEVKRTEPSFPFSVVSFVILTFPFSLQGLPEQ